MNAPDTPSIEALRQQAQEAFRAGEHDAALAHLREAIQLAPQDASLGLDLARMTFQCGNLKDAQAILAQLPESIQNSADAKALSALFQFSAIIADAPSIETVQASLQQDPNDHESLYHLATYLMLHHQVEEAMGCLLHSIRMDRGYKEERAKQLLLTIFALLQNDHPQLVNAFRRQLQGTLY